MSKYSRTITADGDTDIQLFNNRKGALPDISVYVTGDFGSGTLTVTSSPNGGSVFVPVKDQNGNAISLTDDDLFNVRLMSDATNPAIIRFSLSGSSSPDIDVDIFDIR